MSHRGPKISVVTVVLNGVTHLEATMRSVLDQAYPNLEYLVIDGGSTDGTLDVIRRYAQRLAWWVSEPDAGLYDAMNKGIRAATGDLIGIINAGDSYLPGAFAAVSAVPNARSSVVTGDMIKFDEARAIEFLTRRGPADLAITMRAMPLNHPATFVGADVYHRIGVFDTEFAICADNEFILRAIRAGVNVVFLQTALARMGMGGLSESPRSIRRMAEEHYRIRQKHGCPKWVNAAMLAQYLIGRAARSAAWATLPEAWQRAYYHRKRR